MFPLCVSLSNRHAFFLMWKLLSHTAFESFRIDLTSIMMDFNIELNC
jgi:hypothetical protein